MEELFDKYTAAFDALDASKIANLYTLPCATSDGDGQAVYDSESILIDKFNNNCEVMSATGYIRSTYNILTLEQLGSNACAVTLGWKTLTKNNEFEFRGHYVCHKINEQWKIFTAQVFQGAFE